MAAVDAFTRAIDRQSASLEMVGRAVERGLALVGAINSSGISDKLVGAIKSGLSRIPGTSSGLAKVVGKGVEDASSGLAVFAKTASVATVSLLKFGPAVAAAAAGIAAGFKIPVIGNFAKLGVEAIMLPLRKLGAGFSTLMAPISAISSRADMMATALSEAGKSAFAWVDALSNSQKYIQNAATGLMSSIREAMTDPLQALPALVDKIRPFVSAFNPQSLELFDDALRSVYAVIGEALVPVVRIAADATREFAQYLRPAMEGLRPVFENMARFMGGFLKDMIPTLASVVRDLVPVFQQWLTKMKDNMEAWPDLTRAMIAWKMGAGSAWGVVIATLTDLLRKIPIIGKMIGGPEKGPMPKGDMKKEGFFSFGAPTNPTFMQTESLSRDITARAYAAMPGMADQQKDEKDLLAEIAENTRRTADNTKGNGFDANTYDNRIKAGIDKPGLINSTVGAAQWYAGQATEGVYNFTTGVGNLFSGRKWSEGMVDI